jgi:hypothetical protein
MMKEIRGQATLKIHLRAAQGTETYELMNELDAKPWGSAA